MPSTVTVNASKARSAKSDSDVGLLRNFIAYFVQGLKDLVLGAFKVYSLERTLKTTAAPEGIGSTARPSVLALRRPAQKKKDEKECSISTRIRQCICWNLCIFLVSLLLFYYAFLPGLQWITHLAFGRSTLYNSLWYWMGPLLSAIFGALWVLPLFLVSKVVNSLWFQDIADAAWETKQWKHRLPNVGLLIADILFSMVVQTLFLLQSMLATVIPLPLIGQLFSLVHLSLLYSMYAFEYRWFNMGMTISDRVARLENQWPYFLGFGLPLATVTSCFSSIAMSGCVFSALFPLLIISASEAETISETYDFPLHLFAVVMKVSSFLFGQSVKRVPASRLR